jgi:hypothetical protein
VALRILARRYSKVRLGLAFVPVAALLASAPGTARGEDPSMVREGGFGFAAAIVSLGYGPLKLAYALSGLVLGGSSYLWTWGDQQTAMTVVAMSVGGDYVITPAHLGGADDIRFTGDPTQ